jgi:predicted DCC family thiol-disulfide oxidoreductase YuxK
LTPDLLAGRAAGASAKDSVAHPILLYDGVCGLCNRLVQFILRRDPDGIFRFASLQSALAERVLARHGADAHDLDTVYVVVDYGQPDERILLRSDAIIFILRQMGTLAPVPASSITASGSMFWRVVALLTRLVPRPLRDWGYGVVARNRYRVFGRSESCILPAPAHRDRFLDL